MIKKKLFQYYELSLKFYIVKVAFKVYFLQCNICFKYVSNIFYIKKVIFIYLFSFEYIMIFML